VSAITLRQVCWIRRRLRVERNCEWHAESQTESQIENERHHGPEFAGVHGFILSRLL
jgi:hypothetical protein